MQAERFEELVLSEHKASLEVMIEKAKQYATDDRLANFKQAAGMLQINPVQALMGMLVKHFVSVGTMAKNPTSYNLELWQEKLRDIRNYTYLLAGLLEDLEVK